MEMYCRQCEQTAGGKACQVKGVCGKSPETSFWQDRLILGLIGLSGYGLTAWELGFRDKDIERFVLKALFTTVTNVNFDADRVREMLFLGQKYKEQLKGMVLKANPEFRFKNSTLEIFSNYEFSPDPEKEKLRFGEKAMLKMFGEDEDIRSLRELLLYGLKGMAAYADHATILGYQDEKITEFFYRGLASLGKENLSADDYLGLLMELGKVNLACLELLDQAHTAHFGHPVPTPVWLGHEAGPAILVSGHDLLDLKQLLEQTEGNGVKIYTHGEMLPAHGYPGLKCHPHLFGHYGSAWQNQQEEFPDFPGAILMTTNCLQKPRETYQDRIFTTGVVGWPGVVHIPEKNGRKDFSQVIEKALSLKGFPERKEEKYVTVGFGHHTLTGVLEEI
ncbi:MAG: hydroxylamine reductase, partial [Candidatus Omnitrophica bacterium]|nr:hydroxylamine reductase [Candidatus Omnitrophota bacterium]